MNFVKRAWRYICRKRGKTFLLFLIFFVADSMVFGTLSMMESSDAIQKEIEEQSFAKVTIECLDEKGFSEEDVGKVESLENIGGINRLSQCEVYPNDFAPVAGGEEEGGGKIRLLGFDDLEKDSPFEEGRCRIVNGDFIKSEKQAVISRFLAEMNGLEIGDPITFMDESGGERTVEIAGFFQTGSEREQTDKVDTVNRMENQVYVNTNLIKDIQGENYRKFAAYVKEPKRLEETEEKIQELFEERADVGTLDTVYQQIKFSLSQTERIARLVFYLTIFTAVFITGLLLCMWMRGRKTEIAVFISLGISRMEILFQTVLETIVVYSAGCMISAGISAGVMNLPVVREAGILPEGAKAAGIAFSFSAGRMLLVWGVGSVVIVFLAAMAIAPCFRKNIKEILSEMEG
ncbi:MAG: ABC transporter permease [Coprococcus sp.]|nr:ABC transporter permease [Coprococcus sp.]